MKAVVIYGAGSQTIVLAEFLDRIGYEVVAVFNDWPTSASPIAGVPVICSGEAVERWLGDRPPGELGFMVAIGNQHGARRLELHRWLSQRGLAAADAIHPRAYIAQGAEVGPGCQILMSATVGAKACLGSQVILNTAASVDHECVVGDGVHLGPGARLSGRVKVGRCTFIGMGAVVLPDVTIGEDVIIGAGAVVTRPVPDGQIFAGVPARILKKRPDNQV